MSLIVIKSPLDGSDSCATCLNFQLRAFRNKIKEQWNRYNNDGKHENRVELQLDLDPKYLMEQSACIINGSGICVTHMFNAINATIESEEAMREAAKKPNLEIGQAGMDGFLRKRTEN